MYCSWSTNNPPQNTLWPQMSNYLVYGPISIIFFSLTWKFVGDSKFVMVLSLKWLTGPQNSIFFWYLELLSYEYYHSCFCIFFHSLAFCFFFSNASLLMYVVILVFLLLLWIKKGWTDLKPFPEEVFKMLQCFFIYFIVTFGIFNYQKQMLKENLFA